MPRRAKTSNSRSILLEKAKVQLHEKGNSSQELDKFRTLIHEELEDLNCPDDDEFLIRFLRARKFHSEEALTLLRQYYEMRRDNPALFKNITPKHLKPTLDKRLQTVLSSRDSEGRQIFIFRAGVWDPVEVSLDEIFRCNYLHLEEMTSNTETQINGITAIVDFKGFSFFHCRYVTPLHAKRMVQIIQGNFPCRFQEFHLVNQPYVFHLIYSIVKPFLTEKIRNRIHIHGNDLESLHSFLKPKILPKSFLGGRHYNSWDDDWTLFMKQMLDKNQHYEDMSRYGFQECDHS